MGGNTVSKDFVERYNKKRKRSGRGSLLLVGLDGAGKTTILYRLVKNQTLETIPTMGHNKETIPNWGRKWDIFDVGGSVLVRETWRLYARAADGIIFVVDSTSDKNRFEEAQNHLHRLLLGEEAFLTKDDSRASTSVRKDEQLLSRASTTIRKDNEGKIDIPLLVMANKQDLPGAADYATVEKKLNIKGLGLSKTLVLPTNGKTGESLTAGLMWITETINGS